MSSNVVYLLSVNLIPKHRSNTHKPIFHQNAKYLASGAGVGQCPRRQNFALEIPTCWYLKCENLGYPTPTPPTPNLKFAVAPTPNPGASQWNIGCVGSSGVGHVYFMYISCIFHALATRELIDANPVSSGIWAIESANIPTKKNTNMSKFIQIKDQHPTFHTVLHRADTPTRLLYPSPPRMRTLKAPRQSLGLDL